MKLNNQWLTKLCRVKSLFEVDNVEPLQVVELPTVIFPQWDRECGSISLQ